MNSKLQSNNALRQSGVTLVELLIAMLIGSFLIGGVLQVFSGARQTYRVHDATSRMQESGRMALEVLARDIRMADFWGCSGRRIDLVNNLNPDGVGYPDFVNGGLVGTEGASGAPDSIILRGGFDSGITVVEPYGSLASATVFFSKTGDLTEGDIVTISDCSNGDVFQITSINEQKEGGKDKALVNHNTGSGYAPGNKSPSSNCKGSNEHCLSKVYNGDGRVLITREIEYEISDGSEGQPALFRKVKVNGNKYESQSDTEEFLDGIENLQIVYGEDIDSSGIADYYVPADQVVNMDNVISIRFAVVVRSYDDFLTGGLAQNYNVLGTNVVAPDQRLRQVYTSTIAVRNRL